ncbi:MAG: single-stranded-DNA-specific exonuclease RecJ [Candidatus Omnitrophica bacterium]|nr:single-stranded-DNA-specific exonuclease RecJ [Candidatus Omnitrophota bacterium]
MNAHKVLNTPAGPAQHRKSLAKELDISEVLAAVLINRGIKTAQEADRFLHVKLSHLHDPFAFNAMPAAVKLIKDAIKNKHRILLHGDYDVDGITALSVLKNTLAGMGALVDHHIPHRLKEGYGLHKTIPGRAKEKDAKLFITADCGTNSDAQIAHLRALGIDVIITDHHEPADPKAPSSANAVINPKWPGSGYPYRDLAGVGVAYKLCQALTGSMLEKDLDLVSLGTIADSVPLTGENRVIAKEGLLRIASTQRVGLRTLIESSGIGNKSMRPDSVSFILGPRINASGRMDSAEVAFNLLSSVHAAQAKDLAGELERFNRSRQKVESSIIAEAIDLINSQINFREHKIIVVAKEGWHLGVLGIVASKLADRFNRPVILISINDDFCRGSGRSIGNFSLFDGLASCRDLLDNFGGHQHAIGMVIQRDNILEFKARMNKYAMHSLVLEDLLPSISVDMELGLKDINEKLLRELEDMAPYGEGNPKPLFITKSLRLKGRPRVLGRDTLKFWVTDGNITHQAIGFGMKNMLERLCGADSFDLVYNPRIDSWLGEDSTILEVEEILL